MKHFYNIYNASAGSGKTFNLVKEYLKIEEKFYNRDLFDRTNSGMLVAHTHKDNRNEIVISDFFKDSIKTIEPIEIKKKNKTLKILTVDNILDF